jgi:hypothetical protein
MRYRRTYKNTPRTRNATPITSPRATPASRLLSKVKTPIAIIKMAATLETGLTLTDNVVRPRAAQS